MLNFLTQLLPLMTSDIAHIFIKLLTSIMDLILLVIKFASHRKQQQDRRPKEVSSNGVELADIPLQVVQVIQKVSFRRTHIAMAGTVLYLPEVVVFQPMHDH